MKMREKTDRKRFARYDECVKLYGIGRTKLIATAKEAGAVYRLNRLALVDLDKLDAYIETFLEVK